MRDASEGGYLIRLGRGMDGRSGALSPPARAGIPVSVLSLLVIAGACEPAPAPPGVTVRDSAGVRIVESAEPIWSPEEGWTVATDPDWTADGESDFGGFSAVESVARVGPFVVAADPQTGGVYVFDLETGNFVRQLGSQGQGPEEFGAPAHLAAAGDEVVAVWDWGNNRYVEVGLDGTFRERLALTGIRNEVEGATPRGVQPLDDGLLVLREGDDMRRSTEGAPARDEVHFYLVDRERMTARQIFNVPGLTVATVELNGRTGYRPAPFSLVPSWTAAAGRLLVASTDRYEISAVRPGGGLEIHRRTTPPPALDESHRSAYRDLLLRDVPEPARAVLAPTLDQLPYPDRLPAYTGIVQDPQGGVWAQRSSPSGYGPGPGWDVYDPDGAWLGTVATPAGLTIRVVGEEFVVGVWEDEFGVTHLRRYGLSR